MSLNASPLEYIVLGVAGIEILFGKSDSSYAIFNCRENRERMVTLLHMLLAEADRSLDGCETVCQDLLEVLLIWLVRCTTLSLQVEETPRSDSRECVEIKRYLDSNYREDISLDGRSPSRGRPCFFLQLIPAHPSNRPLRTLEALRT